MGSAPTEPSPMNEFMGDDACCPSDAIIAPLGARFDFVGLHPRLQTYRHYVALRLRLKSELLEAARGAGMPAACPYGISEDYLIV